MSDQDEEFQQRWGFRRNGSDLDSSSDDRSEPNSPSEPKLKKHKLTCSEENNQETINIESDPEAEVQNKEPTQSCKKKSSVKSKGTPKESKSRSRKPKKKNSDNEAFDSPLNELRCYTDSLIQGIKVARGDLLKWMTKEMEKPNNIQDDLNSSKPNVKGKGQKINPRRSKFANNSPNKGRRKPSTKPQKQDEAASSEKAAKGVFEAVEPIKEPENVPNSTEKEKRKRSRPSVNKPKVSDDHPSSKSAVVALPAAAAAPNSSPNPNYLTLPTVINNRSQAENPESNPPSNALNMGINLNTYFRRKDGVFAQNGFRNVNDYDQNTGLKLGNMNGNGSMFPGTPQTKDGGFVQNTGMTMGNSGSGNAFPFSLQPHPHPQSFNGGIGMQNPGQFGLQFLSQDNRLSGMRMNEGTTGRLPNGNCGFLESYAALNPNLRFKTQGGHLGLGLQFPDIRGTNFQPR